jgi:hypothetical protein
VIEGELAVGGGFAKANAKLLFASVDDIVAAAQPTTQVRTHLNVKLPHRLPVEEGVKGGCVHDFGGM